MLSVAYNNLAVGLFGMGLDTDLPALQLLIDRAAAAVRRLPPSLPLRVSLAVSTAATAR